MFYCFLCVCVYLPCGKLSHWDCWTPTVWKCKQKKKKKSYERTNILIFVNNKTAAELEFYILWQVNRAIRTRCEDYIIHTHRYTRIHADDSIWQVCQILDMCVKHSPRIYNISLCCFFPPFYIFSLAHELFARIHAKHRWSVWWTHTKLRTLFTE